MFEQDFAGRCLAFDSAAARQQALLKKHGYNVNVSVE